MRCAHRNCQVEFGFFNWKYLCGHCGRHLCSGHIERQANALLTLVPEFSAHGATEGVCARCEPEWDRVLQVANTLRPFGASYRGRVPVDHSQSQTHLATTWHREKSDAEYELRLRAAGAGFDLLFDMAYNRSTQTESTGRRGQFTYSIWQAHGTAAHRSTRSQAR